jgi:hypothetical protein
MANKAALVWRGITGRPESHASKITIDGVLSAEALATFKTAAEAWSVCKIVQTSFNTFTAYEQYPSDGNVDRTAVCYFKDVSNGDMVQFTICDPVSMLGENAFTEQLTVGERVTYVGMMAVKAALEAATGKTLNPLYGVVTQKD